MGNLTLRLNPPFSLGPPCKARVVIIAPGLMFNSKRKYTNPDTNIFPYLLIITGVCLRVLKVSVSVVLHLLDLIITIAHLRKTSLEMLAKKNLIMKMQMLCFLVSSLDRLKAGSRLVWKKVSENNQGS